MIPYLLFRGGSELGREWYEDGKLGKKMNSFKDFISVADYLIANKVTKPEYLSAIGTSAGGLLVGKLLYIFVFERDKGLLTIIFCFVLFFFFFC